MDSSSDEEQLVNAAQSGDKAAMGQLLLNAYDDLSSYLQPKIPAAMQRHLSIEDLIQQVYARAFLDLAKFEYRGVGSFRAWLRSIGEFRLRDATKEMQRKKRGGDRIQIDTANAKNSAADVMAMLTADDPTASRVLRHHEAEQAMQLAIAELPEDYRQVIQLRYFEMRSIQETAKLMSRSEASVRALTDRAKKQLREAIGRISMYLSSRGR